MHKLLEKSFVLTLLSNFKTIREIPSHFVAFSEHMNLGGYIVSIEIAFRCFKKLFRLQIFKNFIFGWLDRIKLLQ